MSDVAKLPGVFRPDDRVTAGGRTGTVVPHERLAWLCRPVAVTWWDRWLLGLARRVRPVPAPPVVVADGRVYDNLVPVAWDDGSVSVTRAHLLRPVRRRVPVGVGTGA